jgi:hypothetical protein
MAEAEIDLKKLVVDDVNTPSALNPRLATNAMDALILMRHEVHKGLNNLMSKHSSNCHHLEYLTHSNLDEEETKQEAKSNLEEGLKKMIDIQESFRKSFDDMKKPCDAVRTLMQTFETETQNALSHIYLSPDDYLRHLKSMSVVLQEIKMGKLRNRKRKQA